MGSPRQIWALAALFALSLVAVSALGASAVPGRDAPPVFPKKERVTLLLVGDTGQPGPDMEAIRRAILLEKKDAIVVLGDLIYPVAPKCPTGALHRDALRLLDERTGGLLRGLGAPVLLVLGNHDVAGKGRAPEREACMLAYAAREPDLFLPDLSYDVDFGVLRLGLLNTNALDGAQAKALEASWKGFDGWRVVAGHHVYRTYHDKVHENLVAPWLSQHRLRPDIYLNGHAHILQFGVYDGIAALTSGATALTRRRPACPPNCGAGQEFGSSKPGYALLTVDRDSMTVVYKDTRGEELFRWSTTRKARAAKRRR
jgi:predicted phosphodiesterase